MLMLERVIYSNTGVEEVLHLSYERLKKEVDLALQVNWNDGQQMKVCKLPSLLGD